jgi:hypothetical protein
LLLPGAERKPVPLPRQPIREQHSGFGAKLLFGKRAVRAPCGPHTGWAASVWDWPVFHGKSDCRLDFCRGNDIMTLSMAI